MKLVRTFHPVGHGAFCTERFYDARNNNIANIVYDCGTKTNIGNLLTHINKEFTPADTINAVFISHFHEDHINGLFGASSVANRVLLGNLTNDNPFRDAETIFVENDYTLPLSPSTHNHPLWEYRAYRLPNYSPTFSHRYTQLIQALQSDPLFSSVFNNGNLNCRSLYRLLASAQNINILKNILKSNHIRLDNNSFNMIVSSQRTRHFALPFPSYFGCLYTGDAELKSRKRMTSLQSRFTMNKWNYHIIQVPHHGANKNNHNRALYDKWQLCIISAKKHDLHHPNTQVIADIINKNCLPKIVTEDPRTMAQLTYII